VHVPSTYPECLSSYRDSSRAACQTLDGLDAPYLLDAVKFISHAPLAPTFSQTTALANLYFRRSRGIHHVPELSTNSDSSHGTLEVDDGHLEKSDLFDLYGVVYVSLAETRFSDNSGDEPMTEPAPPSHVDTTVSQPFRRWMTTPRRRHLERQKGWHTEPLVYRSVSKMATRMGRYRQITCTSPYAACLSR
jgi:hypothetical protein